MWLQKTVFFWSLLLITNLTAQIQDLRFLQYNMDDGLAYDNVNCIFQDSRGYIWIGTELGLSRFDGIGFKNYYNRWEDSTSLSENRISDILEDSLGHLWIATRDGGLNRFDPKIEEFKSYQKVPGNSTSIPDNYLRCLLLDADHTGIWIGTYQSGLVFFDFAAETFTQFLPELDNKQQDISQLDAIIQDPQDQDYLWLGEERFLYRFDKRKRVFTRYQPELVRSIHSLYTKNGIDIWLGTWGGGLQHFNVLSNTWRSFLPQSFEPTGNKNVIQAILPKSSTELWVADSSYGLGLFNMETGAFDFALPDLQKPYKLTTKRLKSLFYDRQGIMWVGSNDNAGGVYVMSPAFNQIQQLELPPYIYEKRSERMRVSDFVYSEKTGKLLSSLSSGSGISIFDEDLKQHEWVKYSTELITKPLSFIFQDRSGNIWTSNWGQLMHFDLEKRSFIPVMEAALARLTHRPHTYRKMYQDNNGILWASAVHGGFFKINPALDSIEQFIASKVNPDYPESSFIMGDFCQAPDGKFWLTRKEDGIACFDPASKTFQWFTFQAGHLIDPFNHSIFAAPDGMIWIGTNSHGIQIFDPEQEKTIRVLDRNTGLLANSIREMAADKNGNLWISSINGLIYYDFETGNLRTFTEKEGLLYPWIEDLYISENNYLFAGAMDRINYFHIDSLGFNPLPPPIVFQSFKVNNREWPLSPGIDYQKAIELKHNQNVIAISFAALNYINSQDNEYRYFLEGADRDWQYSRGRNRAATYANLNPGTYTFHLKAANNDGRWNENERQLIIKIHPPWWGTQVAYASYLLVIFGLIYAFYTFQLRRRLATAEAQRLREMDQAKTRLYTNITHEFRTPLTVIMGMVDQIKKNLPAAYQSAEKVGGYLKMIRRNGQQLLDLVNQMLDLRKLETETFKLKPIQADILPFLHYICESFQSLAEIKQIRLVYYSEINEQVMDFDPEQLEKVLSNLLSNAIKFTPEGGKIVFHTTLGESFNTLGVSKTPRVLKIKIQDNGLGISPEHLPHLFDRFYQVDTSSTRQGEGTGIGLALVKELVDLMNGTIKVESELDKGTTFQMRLPISQEAPSAGLALTKKKSTDKVGETATNKLPLAQSEEMPLCLIVEDNADVAEYLFSCLKKDYRLEWAKDGVEGIEKAIELIPDILISDVMMPRKNGFELCNTLKQDERTSHIPIILLTAKATQSDRIEGLQYGADAYLVKPFDQMELEIRLQKLIQIRQQLQERYRNLDEETIQQQDAPDVLFLRKLRQIVETHLDDEDFGPVPLCEALHLSRMQVHRKIKALTNLSTTLYIRKIRLKYACLLLQKTNHTVSEIAYQVGFRDPDYFSRVFLQEYDVSPSEFRK